MAAQRVADMTAEELKVIITEVVEQKISAMKTSLLQEISDLIESKSHFGTPAICAHDAYVLLKRTEAEQREITQTLIDWLDMWAEEGDEQEYIETFEYVQKVATR